MTTKKKTIDIHMNHSSSRKDTEFYTKEDGTLHTVGLSYIVMSYFNGETIGDKRIIATDKKLHKYTRDLYADFIENLQEMHKDNTQLRFYLPCEVESYNLPDLKKYGSKFVYIKEQKEPWDTYLFERSATLAYCYGVERGIEASDTFGTWKDRDTHQPMKRVLPEFHVSVDASYNSDTRKSSAVCVSQNGEVWRKHVSDNRGISYAELEAIRLAVEKFAVPGRNLVVNTDCAGFFYMMAHRNWSDKNCRSIMDQIQFLMDDAAEKRAYVSFRKVKSHSGDKMHDLADRLATSMNSNGMWGDGIEESLLDLAGFDKRSGARVMAFDNEHAFVQW